MNLWKIFLKKNGDNQTYNKKNRSNLLSETLFHKTKEVIFGSSLTSTVILRRMVVPIGTRFVKVNNPGKAFHF